MGAPSLSTSPRRSLVLGKWAGWIIDCEQHRPNHQMTELKFSLG